MWAPKETTLSSSFLTAQKIVRSDARYTDIFYLSVKEEEKETIRWWDFLFYFIVTCCWNCIHILLWILAWHCIFWCIAISSSSRTPSTSFTPAQKSCHLNTKKNIYPFSFLRLHYHQIFFVSKTMMHVKARESAVIKVPRTSSGSATHSSISWHQQPMNFYWCTYFTTNESRRLKTMEVYTSICIARFIFSTVSTFFCINTTM